MCFSMGASFAAGGILLTIGYAALSQARTPQQHILCALPLLFSFQQVTEGVLWLTLQDHAFARWKAPPLYLFLFLAQVVWPTVLPLIILLIEKDPVRKKILYVFVALGIATSAGLLYGLWFQHADASIGQHHIKYTLDFPFLNRWYGGIPYLVATTGAPVLSSNPRMRLIGAFLLISYLVTRLLYKDYLISIWCYLATAISLIALFDIIRQNRLYTVHREKG